MIPRILIAGIGNIFMGDDAFGSEVAQRLARRSQRAGVKVVDFGIRGLDLTYALGDGWDVAILIDAVPRGGRPGELYLLEPTFDAPAAMGQRSVSAIDPHSMNPMKVLQTASAMGAMPGRVYLVGCEPGPPPAEDEEFPAGMSEAVEAAVEPGIALVESIIEKIVNGQATPQRPSPSPSLAAAASQPEAFT